MENEPRLLDAAEVYAEGVLKGLQLALDDLDARRSIFATRAFWNTRLLELQTTPDKSVFVL